MDCLVVSLGGALGVVLRYGISVWFMDLENGFPMRTFCINILGSFLIGLVAALAGRDSMDPRLVLFLKVGICGGFTTFSSFALETEGLVRSGSTGLAVLYVAATITLGLLAVLLAGKAVEMAG